MRLLVQRLRRKPPHAGEGRIEQPHAAVAAEHGDAFGEVVERFALDADQGVETPLQIEPLGDVVEQIGDAAFGIGRGDDAQRAAVGQVPGVLLRLDARGRRRAAAPSRPEIPLLGQLARRAQRSSTAESVGCLSRNAASRSHSAAIGGVIEGQPVLGVEHGNAGGELIERAAMRLGHPRQRAAHRLGFGGVDGDAGAAGVGANVEHIEAAPRAGDDRRQAAGKAPPAVRARAMFSRAALSSSSRSPLDGVGGIGASTARA